LDFMCFIDSLIYGAAWNIMAMTVGRVSMQPKPPEFNPIIEYRNI